MKFKIATEDWELAGARSLRYDVFCLEQRVFSGSDVDENDNYAATLVAITDGACIAGTVRIHEAEPGVWFGSRLAVRREFRRAGLVGPGLIRLAVAAAHARGAHSFFAHVQSPNVPLFQRLQWTSLHEETLHGLPHHLMQADLLKAERP